MNETMNETIAQYAQLMEGSNLIEILAVALLIAAIYFLPTLLAAFFNRKHLVKIAVLNLPAGFSILAWLGLMVWAITGKRRAVVKEAESPGGA